MNDKSPIHGRETDRFFDLVQIILNQILIHKVGKIFSSNDWDDIKLESCVFIFLISPPILWQLKLQNV